MVDYLPEPHLAQDQSVQHSTTTSKKTPTKRTGHKQGMVDYFQTSWVVL